MASPYKHNILFLGKFYPEKLIETINKDSKGKVGFSNHNFELSIIYGLDQQAVNLRVLTIPAVYSWPHNNKQLYTHSESYMAENIPVKSAGFCNVLIINRISVFFTTFFNLLWQYRCFEGRQMHVIANTPGMFMLKAFKLSRWFTRKKLDITAIIPDIPSMVTQMHDQSNIKGKLVAWLDRRSIQLLGQCERHVLLTEAMTDFFDKPISHIVMEGLIDERNYTELSPEYSNKRIILYTGSVHRQFGIMNLVEAFEKATLPQDVELWICGSGDASDELKRRTDNNNSIKFWGLVDSQKAREMQRKASVLVNPRTSEHAYTKYSFPSKTLEYMMTGKPVVMNRLPGVPEEYFDYVITPKDESISQWAITLEELMGDVYEEAMNKGVAGREFVLNNKNAKKQMERVVRFIVEE